MNRFVKALTVGALIVPCLFGLTACKKKKEYKEVDASSVYEVVRTAMTTEQTSGGLTVKTKIGITETNIGEFYSSTAYNVVSVDFDNKQAYYMNYAIGNGEKFINEAAYVVKEGENRKLYEQNGNDKSVNSFDVANWENAVADIMGSSEMTLPAITNETTFDQFKEIMDAVLLDLMGEYFDVENATLAYTGRSYKNGNKSIIISFSDSVEGVSMDMNTELVVRKGKLASINITVDAKDSVNAIGVLLNIETSYEYSYNSSNIPADLSSWGQE